MARSSLIWKIHMRRSVSLLFGLTAGAVFFAACRDAAVAPVQPLAPVSLRVPPVSLEELESSSTAKSFSVTIDPTVENLYSDGVNSIRFPANSICDPATSSYGPATWDDPCTPAREVIELPITLSVTNGRLSIEFGRDLRFVPSSDAAGHVVLTVDVPEVATTTESVRRFAIFWVPGGTDTLVDEGASDASLITIVKQSEGLLVRRLKHFSGYNLSLGVYDDCDPNTDPNCVESAPEGTVEAQ